MDFVGGSSRRHREDNMTDEENTKDKPGSSAKSKVKEIRFKFEGYIESPCDSPHEPCIKFETSPLSEAAKTPLGFDGGDMSVGIMPPQNDNGIKFVVASAGGEAEVQRGRRRGRAGIRTREKTPFSPRTLTRISVPDQVGDK